MTLQNIIKEGEDLIAKKCEVEGCENKRCGNWVVCKPHMIKGRQSEMNYPMKRIFCKGVGDNNGFYELEFPLKGRMCQCSDTELCIHNQKVRKENPDLDIDTAVCDKHGWREEAAKLRQYHAYRISHLLPHHRGV